MRIATFIVALTAGLSSAGLAAQPTTPSPAGFEAKDFFPPDHAIELGIDFDRLLETEVWRELDHTLAVGIVRVACRQILGFRIDALREVRLVARVREVHCRAIGTDKATVRFETDRALLFRSTKQLSLPESGSWRESDPPRRKVTIGKTTVVQERQDELWVQPESKSLVLGTKEWISSVLEGGSRGRLPRGLVGFRIGSRPLAFIAIKLRYDQEYLHHLTGHELPMAWFTQDDAPVLAILRFDEDPETHASVYELEIRFTNGRHGPELFREHLQATLTQLTTRFWRGLHDRMKTTIDRNTLTVRCSLPAKFNGSVVATTVISSLAIRELEHRKQQEQREWGAGGEDLFLGFSRIHVPPRKQLELEIVCDVVGEKKQTTGDPPYPRGHRVHYEFEGCRLDTEAELLAELRRLRAHYGPDTEIVIRRGKGTVYADLSLVLSTLGQGGFHKSRWTFERGDLSAMGYGTTRTGSRPTRR